MFKKLKLRYKIWKMELHMDCQASLEPVHNFFNFSYASYQVIPRSIAQSMPLKWQRKFVRLMNEVDEECAKFNITTPPKYKVLSQTINGKFCKDKYADYERGRRNVFYEKVK